MSEVETNGGGIFIPVNRLIARSENYSGRVLLHANVLAISKNVTDQ
ncbi:MAG: hypothetical protein V7K50_13070 [Nostoc sp.]